MIHLGDVPANSTLYIPFASYDSNGASVTLSGLAVTDIEIYKNGSTTQRASDNGYTLLDTDGIDFDGITGLHGFSVDLSDNTDSGFYSVGGFYWVVVSTVTISTQTVTFIAATFRIVAAEAVTGKPKVDVDAWLGTAAATPTVAGVPEVDVTHFNGTAGTFSSGRPEVNTTHAAGTAWNSGAIGAATLASDTITDAKVASDVTIASVTGSVGSVTGSVGSIAAGGIAASSFAAGAIDAAAIAADAIGSSELAASAVTEIQSGLSTLTEANIRTAVGLASANLDTQLSTIDDFLDTEVAAIKAKTDQLTFTTANRVDSQVFGVETGAITAGAIAADAIGASELAADAANEIADAILDRSDGVETGMTPRGALRLMGAVIAGKVSGAGTGTEVFRNAVADSKARVTATVDTSGNRTAITTDVT